MILIVCSVYSATILKLSLLLKALKKQNLETKHFVYITDRKHANIKISRELADLIIKATIILLFIQPFPSPDWVDPFDSYFNTIYSFIYCHPCAKGKTTLMAPFVLQGSRFNKLDCQKILQIIWDKSKANHFEIFPKTKMEFLNPPKMIPNSTTAVRALVLNSYYLQLIALCEQKIKKS